jgi:hypothetical protein
MMNGEERTQKLEQYRNAYDELTAALKYLPREMWEYRSAPGEFSVHESLVHICDSEANSYVRCRRAIAEPGSAVLGYDPSAWAEGLHYPDQSTDDALELFRLLRLTSYNLIKDLPEATWSNTIEHSENGMMTLDDWLDVYATHVTEHVVHMRETYAAWQQRS